jgi:hypothetical protein
MNFRERSRTATSEVSEPDDRIGYYMRSLIDYDVAGYGSNLSG